MRTFFLIFTFLLMGLGLAACSTSEGPLTHRAPITSVQNASQRTGFATAGLPNEGPSNTNTTSAPETVAAADDTLLTAPNPAVSNNLGGDVASNMDSIDKGKFSHALDRPLGKTSTWTNSHTKMTYTVSPTQKMTVNGNPYCRQYVLTATYGQKTRQTEGTACINAKSNWQAM